MVSCNIAHDRHGRLRYGVSVPGSFWLDDSLVRLLANYLFAHSLMANFFGYPTFQRKFGSYVSVMPFPQPVSTRLCRY